MLKLISTFLFVIMFVTGTMNAQTLSKPPELKENPTNLKEVFSKETKKLQSDSVDLDAKKMDKVSRQKAPRKWSKKDTLLVVLIGVGIAALVFVAIKYYRKCIRTSPRNCDLYTDDFCTCEEYEPRDRSRAAVVLP